MKNTFTFQKDYMTGSIDSFNLEPELRRYEKILKITDSINGNEHTYIKTKEEKALEYFKDRYNVKTLIPRKRKRR